MMSHPRKFQRVSMNLPNLSNIKTCLKQCLTIIENYSDLKINNKCLSKKLSKEVSPFLKCFHLKRRSSTKKLKRWPIDIVGSYLLINPSVVEILTIFTLSCSSNQKFFRTKKLTDIFTRQ